jgi:Protein of unknown function (DUF4238)
MSEPRDHHYVPHLLLREFAHGHARQWLCVYDKTTDSIFRGSVRKSAERHDYNATARADGTTDAELERIFGILETAGAPAPPLRIRRERFAGHVRGRDNVELPSAIFWAGNGSSSPAG